MRRMLGALLAVLLVGCGGGGDSAEIELAEIELIEVPVLVGRTVNQAKNVLHSFGIDLDLVVEYRPDAEGEPCVIFEQLPGWGHEVYAGSSVVVRIPDTACAPPSTTLPVPSRITEVLGATTTRTPTTTRAPTITRAPTTTRALTTTETGPYGLHPDLKDGVEDCIEHTEDFLAWFNPGIIRLSNAVSSAIAKGYVMVAAQMELAGEQFGLYRLVVTCEELFPRVWSGTVDKIATEIDNCALMSIGPPVSASEIKEANRIIQQCTASHQRAAAADDLLEDKFSAIKEWIG